MRPIYLNLTQTSATTTAQIAVVPLDVQIAPFEVSYGVVNVSGNVRATVAVTLDNLWAAGWDQSAATWFNQASATGISASSIGTIIDFPVTGIRLTLASGIYSGGATLVVVQAGAGAV